MNLPENQKLRLTSQQVSNPLGSGLVILNMHDGTYISLNEVGALLWQALQEQPKTVSELLAVLLDTYEVPVEIARADLTEFVDKLAAVKLIEVVDA